MSCRVWYHDMWADGEGGYSSNDRNEVGSVNLNLDEPEEVIIQTLLESGFLRANYLESGVPVFEFYEYQIYITSEDGSEMIELELNRKERIQ